MLQIDWCSVLLETNQIVIKPKVLICLLVTAIFFCCSCNIKQENKINEEYSSKLKILYDDFRINISNKPKTIEINKDIFHLAEKYNGTFEMIVSNNYIANTYYFLGDYNSAIEYYKESLKIFDSKNNLSSKENEVLRESHLNRSRVLLNLGESYMNIGKIDSALENYNQGIEVAKTEEDDFYIIIGETLVNELNEKIGKYDLVIKDGLRAFKKINQVKSEKQSADIDLFRVRLASAISSAYLNQKKIDSAKRILEIIKNKHHNLLNYKSNIENSYGEIYLEQNYNQIALEKFLAAREIFIEYDSLKGKNKYAFNIAQANFKLKNFDESINELNNLLLDKTLNIFQKLNLYRLLASSYKSIGDVNSSNIYYKKYISLEKDIETAKSLIIDEFHNQEITELKKFTKQKNQKSLFIVFAMFSFLGSLTFYFFYLREKKNRQNFKSLLDKINDLKKNQITKIKPSINRKDIKTSEIQRIIGALEEFIEQEQFLNIDCTLFTTAKKLKTNTTYLSKVINSEYHKNFSSYLNELRVNYALKRLQKDKMFRRYSIQSIANELGYKSKESFNKAFRSQTGILPSYFIKQIEREHS